MGFVKLNSEVYQNPYSQKYSENIFQINRVSHIQSISDNSTWEVSYELLQIYSDQSQIGPIIDYSLIEWGYRAYDLNGNFYRDEKYFLVHNLDRLSYSYTKNGFNIILGRQQISFGSARGTNPIDIFTPFSFNVIDTEVRPGVDAIRVRKELSNSSQFDVGIIFGDELIEKNSAAFVIWKNYQSNLEFAPMFAVFKQAHLYGLDLTFNLWQANWWWENAYVTPRIGQEYLRSSFGGQYQVSSSTSGFFEYHFNGVGSTSPSEYLSLSNEFAYQEANVFLAGRQYLDIGGGYQLSPLTSIQLAVKLNIEDHSNFILGAFENNFSNNYYFNLGAMAGVGQRGESFTDRKSEFGDFPLSLFTRLRYYF